MNKVLKPLALDDTPDAAPLDHNLPSIDEVRRVSEHAQFTTRTPDRTSGAAPITRPTAGARTFRTGRDTAFTTKISAAYRDRLYAVCDAYGLTVGEAMEMAIEGLEREVQANPPRPLRRRI